MSFFQKLKSSFSKHKKLTFVFIPIIVVLLIVGILFDVITPNYSVSLTVAFSGSVVDEDAQAEALETGYALNQEVEEEGAVLLRNDGTLPINTSSGKVKVNVFGVRSAHLVYNSAGSAAGSLAEAVNLKTALEEANFEVNPTLWSKLDAIAVKDNTAVNEGGSSEAVNELAVSEYDFASAKSYSEYAVVTFSRLGGEGADQTRTGMGDDKTYSYLELCENEKELLKKLDSEGFKTIVLINSSYAMELGPLEEYNVNAALWIGGPGVMGAKAIGTLMNGSVTPSGRLVDTYAYDLTTGSAYYTADNYSVVDTDGNKIGGYTDYAEGIYVGYKWYETADAEGFWESDYAKNKWGISGGYDDVIQYPFGFGLSYTEFSQEFAEEPSYDEATGTFTFKVTVKNTGSSYAGKDVVQIYAETPYTGAIEKSKVSLAAYAKTKSLAAGTGEETLTLTVSLEDLASYSESANSGNGAYVLEAGDYNFYLSENAHSWKEQTTPVYTYTLATAVEYSGDNKRTSDTVAATNQLTGIDVRNGTAITTLSRTQNFANAGETIFTPSGAFTVAAGSALYKALVDNAGASGDYNGEVLTNLAVGQAKKYTLADFIDTEKGYCDYDDERWDDFISQMTVADMSKLTGTGGWSTAAIDSIGKDMTTDIDGPFGLSNLIKNSLGIDVNCISYCTEVVMASTFNTELIGRVGEAVAAEANATNVSGWYAPGANIHRSPFSGRNPEYYSEDAFLSGSMCAAEVNGALSKGLYVYVKHFAFNDSEANRTSKQNCYMTEQTAREIYLKPYEMAIKNDSYDAEGNRVTYGATGLMASYMWVNETWVGADSGLMLDILRGEWSFKGVVITDNAGVSGVDDWITHTKALYNGTDLMLVYKEGAVENSSSAESVSALKIASKHILYTIADAASRRSIQAVAGYDWWSLIFVLANVLFFGAAAILFLVLVLKYLLPERKKVAVEAPVESTETKNE